MQAAHDGCWHAQQVALRRGALRLRNLLLASKEKSGCRSSLTLQDLSLKTQSKESPRGDWAELYALGVLGKNAQCHPQQMELLSQRSLGRRYRGKINSQKHQYFKILKESRKE